MAISGISTDYTGRTLDVFISQGIDPVYTNVAQPVAYNFGSISKSCTGVQKLVQRYLIALFNAGLLNTLQQTQNGGVSQIPPAFAVANSTVMTAFNAYQAANPSTLTDEQLNTAELTGYSAAGGSVTLQITILTNAGTTVEFITPLALT